MKRERDFQKARVYRLERDIYGWRRGTMRLPECEAYARRVWMDERARYGLAGVPAPVVLPGRYGARAIKRGERVFAVSLGGWGRRPEVILHELAHCLSWGSRHGAKFVGVLFGLWCRHLGADKDELLGHALEAGVKVDLEVIGPVADKGWHRTAISALERLDGRALNLIELAGEMGVGYRTAWGACLTLLRLGLIRRRGKRIILINKPKGTISDSR